MRKLAFYDVNIEYINYLKKFEPKIPNISYENNDKFVCGVVMEFGDIHYFAPISSFKKQQRTNILIEDRNGKILSSIRFSFMFPIPQSQYWIKDFKMEERKYRFLLQNELKFCNKNIEIIRNKAMYVYKRRISGHDEVINNSCCNFKLLEEKCLEFELQRENNSEYEDWELE